MTEKEFIAVWVKKVAESMKNFPTDFITNTPVKEVELPATRLNLGAELFGTFEIIDNKGKTFLTAHSLTEAKYYIYASRTKPARIAVPETLKSIPPVISAYENYLDGMIKSILQNYNKEFPDGKSPNEAVTQIFYQLDLVRF